MTDAKKGPEWRKEGHRSVIWFGPFVGQVTELGLGWWFALFGTRDLGRHRTLTGARAAVEAAAKVDIEQAAVALEQFLAGK